MNNWTDFFYFFIVGVALLLSGMGLWFTAIMPGIDRWSKRFFLSYFAALFVSCVSCFVEAVLIYFSGSSETLYLVLALESIFLALPLPMLTVYLLHCCGENMRESWLLRIVAAMWLVYVGLLVITLFVDGFSYVTPDGQYVRGAWYPLLILPLPVILLCNLVGTIRRRKRLSHKTFLSFVIAILPMAIAMLVHLFLDVFPILDICIVLSALSMYGLVLSDQIEQDLRHQREIAQHQLEIANQSANIMVLQMRPHFIYNTMTRIYCLCNQDPKLARQVVLDFTTYLRKNFTAIASTSPIPFSSELEHTQAYLAVEQAQYEDSLFVDYDIQHTVFRLPPLTLQPIVENAIKHGRDPYAGPFRISIRTRKTESGSEVVVADNGRGYSPAEDGEPHIALKNIQQRLEIMCGGHLAISSKEGGGTVVTLTIPDNTE